MNILVYSPAFLPWVGGLEINTANLAAQMSREGHRVVVVTTTSAREEPEAPYEVVRQPTPGRLVQLVRWCDVVLHQNLSLRGLWPLLLIRRPLVVSHHSWYCRTNGEVAWPDRLKRWISRRASGSIPVSHALAADLGGGVVIANAYREDLFRRLPHVERTDELLFVGRLVSDKGADVLLDALSLLEQRGQAPALTIVGEGPERHRLEEQAARNGLKERVRFKGTITGESLVEVMNQHRVLVVPSRYREPFGIVALEGIACGCFVVGSSGGGLPEAIGPVGVTFRNGDAGDLARALERALGWREDEAARKAGRHHLQAHTTHSVTARYLEVLCAAVDQSHHREAPRLSS